MKQASKKTIAEINKLLETPSECDVDDAQFNKMSRIAQQAAALKGHPSIIESARKNGQRKKGITLTESHKERIAKSTKATLNTPEVKQKLSEAKKGKALSTAHAAAIGAANKGVPRPRPHRRCTVDGVTIYSSLMELIDVLGSGKAGRRHPDFRYIDEKPVGKRKTSA